MMELTENPYGCTQFAPNPFKKEKCKNCGRLWHEHKGVIADDIVKGYQDALNKIAEDKQKAEEEAKAKLKAKQMAKKKQAQAVEDEWLFEGTNGEQAPESDGSDDDDMSFKMFTPTDMADSAPVEKKPNKPLKVVNLIDFGECDVPEDPTPANGADSRSLVAEPSASSPDATPFSGSGVATSSVSAAASMGSTKAAAGITETVAVPSASRDMDLLTEIQHLRQMLADANEEKSIQVAIVRDEVAEKQQLIEELTKQRNESEAALKEARGQLDALRSTSATDENPASGNTVAPDQERVEAEQYRAEVQRLRTELESLRASAAEADSLRAKVAEADRQLEAAKANVTAAQVEAAAAKVNDETLKKLGSAGEMQATHAEAHAVAQEMGRQTAQALREIRLSAEQQLARLSKRMRDSHHADFSSKAVM